MCFAMSSAQNNHRHAEPGQPADATVLSPLRGDGAAVGLHSQMSLETSRWRAPFVHMSVPGSVEIIRSGATTGLFGYYPVTSP